MKIKYETIALRRKAIAVIERANVIIEELQGQGYALTLRQLYYQFVARDLFIDKYSWTGRKWVLDPKGTINAQPNYDMLGVVISNGRRAGLVDWEAIVDRTRFLRTDQTWDSPQQALQQAAEQFRFDLWADQLNYVELWFEKDALLGVFERSAEAYRLPLCSNRGYMSDSTIWEAAQRIRHVCSDVFQRKKAYILHFGDHDPSGMDMTRDVEERLCLFGATAQIRRVALNMSQVKKYNPPPNWAKQTDSRYEEYKAKYGEESWELDALDPALMVRMVTQQVIRLLDIPLWEKNLEREKRAIEELRDLHNGYDKALRFLRRPPRSRKNKR